MHVADDGAVFVEEAVEQGALADVCLAYDGNGDALLYCLASFERLCEGLQAVGYGMGELLQLAAVGELKVFVVGEVKLQFEQRSEFQQLLAQLCQF